MFPFFSLPKPAAPSNKATTTTTQQQPQQPVVKTFGKKSTQLAPSTSFGPFDRENFEPSVRNQERERDHPPMVKTSSIVKTSSLLRINVEDVNNAVENSGPLSTMSQDSNQSGKGSKKRNSETECEPKNTRQRLSPFPGGGSSRSASGSTPTFEFSSSLSSNASTITTGTRGSKNKQKMKGKKYYSSCILQADNEDINYLKAALDNKVNFTPCIFIPTEFTEEKRIRFALFIESIGFVRNKGDAYYFSNNDLDELHQALQNKDDLPPISSSTFGMLERSRSKSLQSTLSHIDASIDNRLRSTSCAPLIDASPRYERQGSEDGSDCGTPRSMHALSIDDFPSANSNSGRSSTPLGESFLHGWDTKLNLSTGLSPRYPNMDKPFGRSSSISSHTMTEKMTIGANHKRSTSKGTDPFLPMGPPPPPNSATPFPPQPTTTSIMSQQYFNPAMGIASGRNDSFPFFQEESPPSSTSSMAISFHESTSNGPPLTMSETPAVASSPSTGLLSAFIPPKKTLPRKSSAGNSVQMNSDPSPATPALFNAAKANQCFDNYATPQGRVFCAAKYLESKATDSTSIEYLRTKLIKRWQQIQDQKRATMKSELSVSSSISIDSADSSSAAVSVQSTSTLMNSNQANNLQNSDFHRPSVVNISTAPFNPTPFTSAAFSKQTQQSLFDRSFQELGRAGSLELSGNYKLSYEHKQDLLQQQSFTDFQMMKTFDPPPSITLERGASLGGGARVGAVHLASSAAMSLLNNSLNSSSGSPRNHLLGDSVVNAQHFDNSIYVSDEETQTNLHFSHYHQSMSRSNDSAFLTTNHVNHPAISLGAGRGSSTQLMSLDEELDLIGDSFVCHSPSNTFGKTLQGGVRSNRNRQSFFSAKTNKKLSIKKLGKARRQSLFPISERSRLEMSHISLGMNDSQLDDSKSIMIEREGAMTTTTIATNLTGTPDSISSKHKEPLSPIPASQSPMGTPRQLHQSMVLESSNISHSQGSIRRQLRYSLSPLQRSYQMEASNAMGLLSPSLKGGLAMAQLQSSIFTPLFRTSLLIICDCFTNEELLTHVSKVNKILHLFALQTIIKRKDIGANMLKIVGQTRTHRRGGSASSKAAASSHLMQWNDFSNYLSMHRSGYFLGEGACKRVYHVKQSGTNLEKALSIMDVKDMIDRGMEQAIAKEIEITLLCSSLMKFRICPQMIRVFNIFQSNFDPSEKLWKGPSQQNHALKPSISNAEFIKTSLSWSSLSSSSLCALENQTQSNMMMKSTSSITVNNSSVANIPIDKKNCTKGTYQFIEMEFCSCGDVETFLRSMGVPSLVLVKSMLFQMLYSLYCGRVIYTLRHFDIKLLNFFLYKLPLKCDAVVASSDYEGITKSQALIIGFEDLLYRLPFLPDPAAIPNQDVSSSSCMYMIKLGDFGTGVIDHPLDTPVTIQQFTTLENSPPEFLILGERNSQNYSSDTFNLGLCLFHLLNGIAPYEELLEDVRCPEFFISRWQKSWEADPVILEVVESLLPEDDEIEDDDNMIEEEDEDDVILENMMDDEDDHHNNNKTKKKNEKTAEEENPFLIFCHTLYRFLVLFSGCESFTEGFVKNRMYQDSAIWRVIVDTFSLYEKLDQVDQRSFTRMKLKKNDHKLQEICKQQFFKDASRWSFHQGNDPVIRSARQRAEELAGGLEGIKLLDSLLHWDPNQRCTMYEALKSPIFYNFCIDPSNCYQPFSNQPAMKFDCFMRRNEYDRIPVV